MNIFKFELGMMKKSILIWGLAVPVGLIFYMAFFPMMAGDPEAFETIMASFPDEFLRAFGMNPDLPVFTVVGYFSLTFGMIQIPLAIQASNYGFHILSVEERELTADFLLSRPVKRGQIYISKSLAALVSLTIVNIAVWISSIGIIYIIKGEATVNFTNLNILLSSTIFFQLVFFGIGMLVSVSLKKIGSVLSFSMALGFGMYIISSLGEMISSKVLSIMSPFNHFEPAYILVNGHYEWSVALISFAIILITIPLSYFLYLKRNISSL